MILIFKMDGKYMHHYLSVCDAKKTLSRRLKGHNVYRVKIQTTMIEETLPADLKSKILRITNGRIPEHTVAFIGEGNNNFQNYTVSELIAYGIQNMQFCFLHTDSTNQQPVLTLVN